MAKTVNVYEAKTQLSSLIREAAEGEEIVIAKAGVPMARLVPYRQAHTPRRPGGAAGRIRMAKDFNAPLPADVIAAFLGQE